jgi:hypothetical protein
MTAPAEDELQPYFVRVVNGNILPLGFVFRLHLVEFETHLAILGSHEGVYVAGVYGLRF